MHNVSGHVMIWVGCGFVEQPGGSFAAQLTPSPVNRFVVTPSLSV
jgi:hypothetical protein